MSKNRKRKSIKNHDAESAEKIQKKSENRDPDKGIDFKSLSPKKGKNKSTKTSSEIKVDTEVRQARTSGGKQEKSSNHNTGICLACHKSDHKTLNCLLLEDIEVVKCCDNCLSPFHPTEECSFDEKDNSHFDCRNCHESGHSSQNCENLCTWCGKDDGHKRKDCPQEFACRNCHESGHKSFECENVCKFCNDDSDGHMRKDCTGSFGGGNRKFRDGRSGGRSFSSNKDNSNMDCRNCHETGHMSFNCENLCTFCHDNNDEHKRKDCPKGSGSNGNCFNCNKSGHFSRDCPESGRRKGTFSGRGGRGGRGGRFGGSSNLTCFNCNEAGHMSRDCPQKGPGGRGN